MYFTMLLNIFIFCSVITISGLGSSCASSNNNNSSKNVLILEILATRYKFAEDEFEEVYEKKHIGYLTLKDGEYQIDILKQVNQSADPFLEQIEFPIQGSFEFEASANDIQINQLNCGILEHDHIAFKHLGSIQLHSQLNTESIFTVTYDVIVNLETKENTTLILKPVQGDQLVELFFFEMSVPLC